MAFTFITPQAAVPAEAGRNRGPIVFTGIAAVLGAATLAGTLLYDWRRGRSSMIDHDTSLAAAASRTLADALGPADVYVSSSARRGCLRIELDATCLAGKTRVERERILSQLLESALKEELRAVDFVWAHSRADVNSRCSAEVCLQAKKYDVTEAESETETGLFGDENEDECATSAVSTPRNREMTDRVSAWPRNGEVTERSSAWHGDAEANPKILTQLPRFSAPECCEFALSPRALCGDHVTEAESETETGGARQIGLFGDENEDECATSAVSTPRNGGMTDRVSVWPRNGEVTERSSAWHGDVEANPKTLTQIPRFSAPECCEFALSPRALCGDHVAAQPTQLITADTAKFMPADTWQIRQGIVPELRKQWSRGDDAVGKMCACHR